MTRKSPVIAEIEQYLSDTLARFGAPGSLDVTEDTVYLDAPSGSSQAPLGTLPDQWRDLAEDARRRRAADVVRRLLRLRSTTAPPARVRRSVPAWLGFLVALVGAGLAYVVLSRPSAPTEDVVRRRPAKAEFANAGVVESDAERRERAARVCEVTLQRVTRGATAGPTDVEGWVVDLFLLRTGGTDPLDRHPRLREFLEDPTASVGTELIWPETPELSGLQGPGTRVEVTREEIQGAAGERTPGLRLTFFGRLVDPYFHPEKRVRYFVLADGLFQALGATHAGLFARCDGRSTHHVGSWFRGENAGQAAASLLYLLGTYADPPHLAAPFLKPPSAREMDRAHTWASIRHATGKLSRDDTAMVLGSSGGMIAGRPGAPVTISFPFRDSSRAVRASRDVSLVTSIGRR